MNDNELAERMHTIIQIKHVVILLILCTEMWTGFPLELILGGVVGEGCVFI